MGIFSGLMRRFETNGGHGSSRLARRSSVRPATPHTTSNLQSVVYADALGAEHTLVSREEAMLVPAVANARWLICYPVSGQPLKEYDGTTRSVTDAAGAARDIPVPVADQPEWLTNTGGQEPWQFRTADTLDDMLFEGWSLWKLERSTKPDDGWQSRDGSTFIPAITGAVHVPLDRWDFNSDDEITIDSEVQGELDVILFRSPTDPLLVAGRRTIRGAAELEDRWLRALAAIPVVEIKQDEDIELAEPDDEDADPESREAMDEAQGIVDDYVKARTDPNGAVVFTPYGYSLNAVGQQANHELYIEGRNFQAIDVGRHTAIAANMLSASGVTASLTYETKKDGRSDVRDLVQGVWAMALSAHLSLDTVCAPGHSIAFDLSNLAEQPDDGAGPNVED
ncbi:hypothetical protein [Promicromonospora kroppenstedtii]|uniref:hypothetical protein n=1 Tax=Promicromonospora kroppenstedtii TaxID=440482 RepID=UPI0004AD8576|nr:hypothetical protein [Promicromonospora kroppenstedtii]